MLLIYGNFSIIIITTKNKEVLEQFNAVQEPFFSPFYRFFSQIFMEHYINLCRKG